MEEEARNVTEQELLDLEVVAILREFPAFSRDAPATPELIDR